MTSEHTNEELKELQALPLEAKIEISKARIKSWYEYWDGQVYVSISGGKDSQVLAHLVKSIYPDVPLVFVNTGLEYNSVRLKATEMADEVLRPEMNFVEVIKKYGYPIISKEVADTIWQVRQGLEKDKDYNAVRLKKLKGEWTDKKGEKSIYNQEKWIYLLNTPFKIGSYCCDVMKKRPAKHYEKQTKNKPFIGTMADESRLRRTKWLKVGCNAFDGKRPTSTPLSFWTENDILLYIYRNDLKLAEVYGEVAYKDDDGMFYDTGLFMETEKLSMTGAKRTGCVFCMFGITQDTERFLRLKEVEPAKYDYIMRGGAFDERGLWVPAKDENGKMGLGYKFVIDWLNEHGNLGIKY